MLPPSLLRSRLVTVFHVAGLRRVVITSGGSVILDLGHHDAIAPGAAKYTRGAATYTVRVSTTGARGFARSLATSTSGVVVRHGSVTLASSVPGAGAAPLPISGGVTIKGVAYEALASRQLPSFDSTPNTVTALSALHATNQSLGSDRLFAGGVIAAFVLLAVGFAIAASRGLESQLGRFLHAARRLGGGDFSAPVPVEGSDDFALLAAEFNSMSQQLARRLDELNAERVRLRESIRRAGDAFASNLDRHALLTLALTTAVDGVQAEFGRLSTRDEPDGPLSEAARERSLDGVTDTVVAAERAALQTNGLGAAASGEVHVAALPLGPRSAAGRPYGLLTVGRRTGPFTDDDKDLLRSLATQTTVALENVQLHLEVQRQAVTDELTGLANHGRFQEVLGSEMEQVRRYHYPVALIMIDLDDFKQINDTHGHPQGDEVLRQVARVLKETSREADSAARYGGEEMALILPHTDIEGSYAIAERVRTAIDALEVPMVDGSGALRVTASVGVGVTTEGHKDRLIAETDAALYRAKHAGKNRTERAASERANAIRGG
jgi:diguanylate cyclase (GGDEF)-like protein